MCENERKALNYLPWHTATVLREFVRKALEGLPVKGVILFGSQARRTARESSDIDIALILSRELTTVEHLSLTEIADGLEKRFHVQVQPHPFTEEQFSRTDDPLIKEIKRDGVQLVPG